jgi:hypothetical protein
VKGIKLGKGEGVRSMQGEPLFQMSDEMYILLNDWKHPWKEKEEREMEAFKCLLNCLFTVI